MIETMKFITITGPKYDIDRITREYLSNYEIHLEHALSELNTIHDVIPYVEANPYKEVLAKGKELIAKLDQTSCISSKAISGIEAIQIIEYASGMLEQLDKKKKLLRDKKIHLKELLLGIQPFRSFDFDINTVLNFKFIQSRFGKIPHAYFHKFETYVYETMDTLFLPCQNEKDYIWGVYFVPAASASKIDAICSSLHFERIQLSNQYKGKPEDTYQQIKQEIERITKEQKNISKQIRKKLLVVQKDLLLAYETLMTLSRNHEIRKLAACTRTQEQIFYIICGWITDKNLKIFLEHIKNDSNLYCFVEEEIENIFSKPPTKLKNPRLFKPFELFIELYGLPSYHEIDPTIFVGLTYSFLFGMMFGDVGQGLFLVIGGFLLYKIKKLNLAAILSCAGIFSTLFGFLYGSIFGYEDILVPVWTNPMHNTMTVLYTAIGFGVILTFIAMIFNVLNGIRAKDIQKIFFDRNGIAGLVFYSMAITVFLLAFTGHALPSMILLITGFGIPLILVFLREPLSRYFEKKPDFILGSKGMFFLESGFELFEILLSYITTTVSFVRVGAFALSHAGMMSVVLMLGNATTDHPNFFIIFIGNLFVTGLEGLIVGIQVLRLEYYEIFSRFYKGNGKKFKCFKEELK